MATSGRTGPSDYDGAPGRAITNSDRLVRQQRREARDAGEPEPPIGGRYNGCKHGGGSHPVDPFAP